MGRGRLTLTETAKRETMSSVKKFVPVAVLLGVGAMVGGGVYAYKRAVGKQQEAREQAFADLSQCLLGEVVVSGDDTINGLNATQNRLGHRPDSTRGVVDGAPWPQRCGGQARKMMDAVRDSSFMDDHPKREMLKVLDVLAKDLEAKGATEIYLAGSVLQVWRQAEKAGIAMGKSSSIVGPPKPALMEGGNAAAELPFSTILPVRGGPQWHFLAERKDKVGTIASCATSKEGLTCAEFAFDGSLNPVGTWSDAQRLPVWDGKKLSILTGGKLEEISLDIAGEPRVHVDDKGSVYALGTIFANEEVKLSLAVRHEGKKVKSVALEKALEKASEGAGADAVTAVLVGSNVVIRRTMADGYSGELQMFAIDVDLSLGKPVPIKTDGSPNSVPSVCRVGDSFALQADRRQTRLHFFDGQKWTGPVKSDAPGFDCSAAGGVWLAQRTYCRPSGCIDAFAKEDEDAFMAAIKAVPDSTFSGDKLVNVWSVKEGHGTMVRVGAPGDAKSAEETLIYERSDPKGGGQDGAFGDKHGAWVLSEIEGRVIGAHVTPDGKVGPIKVSSK